MQGMSYSLTTTILAALWRQDSLNYCSLTYALPLYSDLLLKNSANVLLS